MNPYNPISNIHDSESTYISGDYERIAEYHLDKADIALQRISETDPQLATFLQTFLQESLLAFNAYSHDLFERRNPTDEDFLTRLRKNR